MQDSKSNLELRKEAAMIGTNPDFIRPYNLAGRYGCEYYVTHSEISHEVYMSELYNQNYSEANIPTKPRDIRIRENILTRIKRGLVTLKNSIDGGDGSGGGKAIDLLVSGNDPVSDILSSSRSGQSLSNTKLEKADSNKKLPEGGDGGGGKSTNEDGGDNSGGGRSLPNPYYKVLETLAQNETDSFLGVSIKGGDMGGGGAQQRTVKQSGSDEKLF